MQACRQFIQLCGWSNRVGFHAAVVQVSNPSRQTEGVSLRFHERAKSDTLNAPRDQPTTGEMVLRRAFFQ